MGALTAKAIAAGKPARLMKALLACLLLGCLGLAQAQDRDEDRDRNRDRDNDRPTERKHVVLVSPAQGALYTAPANVPLAAEVKLKPEQLRRFKVQFFQGTALIGEALRAPYVYTWTNVAAGRYVLTARLVRIAPHGRRDEDDEDGDTGEGNERDVSEPVTITVNAPPTVSLSAPANGASFIAPAAVGLSAAAADSDGTVAKVEFFQGATLIGTVTAAPYAFQWTNVAAGNYTLTARATDNRGASTTSAAVSINVDAPPTVGITAPAANTVFTAPATITVSANAADVDGAIAKVEFFDGATLIGTATAAPFSVTLTNAAAGAHVLTARATDNQGATATSAAVTITVNSPPTVSLTAPANNAVVTAPANLTLSANAADADGSIAKVEFFQGGTLIGTANAAPFTFQWTNVSAGNYTLTARATDNQGATATSAAVTITVNSPPTVSLTAPANNAGYTAPATITLTANAADADGTIAKVEFYQGTTLIGTVTAAPYGFTWQNVAAGSYGLTAVATDNQGASTTSAAITVRVNAAPTVALTAPAGDSVFQAPATITLAAGAADADGTIARVDFYQGTTLIGGASAAPYSIAWSNVAAGSYSLTAVATDNLGASTTSPPVTVIVNAAPAVTLTSPANNASYTAPAAITLTATAQDSDGSIAKVEFLQGATVLASVTAAPYTFAWTNVAQGTYVLAARATDNNGGIATSAAVTVTVNSGVAALYFIHPDHLNTPRLIADQAGNTVWRNDNTEPFGDSVPNGDPNSTGTTFEFPLRFPGQYADRETGNFYNAARDYWSEGGRYIESDPIGLRGGLNTYAYVGGNPVSRIDAFGLADITYNNTTGTLTIVNAGGAEGSFPASNNAASTSRGPWPQGTFPFEQYNPHPDRSDASDTGTDFFGFRVPSRKYMGVHAGRVGVCDRANRCDYEHATLGCIRTTPDAIDAIRSLQTSGDPIRSITVIR